MPIEELKRPERNDEERIEKLKRLFPEAFRDGKLNLGVLKEDLEMLNTGIIEESNEEYYSLQWAGKKEARKLAFLPPSGTLRLSKGEGIEESSSKNLYIEGDNLEVLRLLQKGYSNKFKMIYADPPYNTGNDFIYTDDFKDPTDSYLQRTKQADEEGLLTSNPKANGRYHTNWLNMMYPRLKLARNLLSNDGVILVSIDDHEQANLKLLLDEIFGEENFIGVFVVNSTPNARDYGHIGKMHEYVLFYAKNMEMAKTYMLPDEEKSFKYEDETGGFNIHPLYNSNVAFNNINRPNLYYPFYLNPLERIDEHFYEISLEKKDGWVEIFPPKSVKDNVQFVWRWGKDKAKSGLIKEIIGYKTGDGEYRIVQKMRHTEKLIRSLLLEKGYTSRRGTAEVEQIFGKKIFTFPKPVDLLYTFTKMATEKDSLVLDFFSGSATLAEAVMKLNSEDNGNRQFVLIQLPEKCDESSEAFKAGYYNICEIGKERIRRVGMKIKNEVNRNIDTGFSVYKLDKSNIQKWNRYSGANVEELDEKIDLFNSAPFVENSQPNDIIIELMIIHGFPLDSDIKINKISSNTIWRIQHIEVPFTLIVCLDEKLQVETSSYLIEEYDKVTFICLDNALSNEQKVLLSESMNVKTI